MEIKLLENDEELKKRVIRYAENCVWDAGENFSLYLKNGLYTDWERAVVALDGEKIAGYCNVLKEDCLPGLPYSPYIGYLFVDEAYRGQRLSQEITRFAEDYLRSVGFSAVYLITEHNNLYEKYGYVYKESKLSPWGEVEKIYEKRLSE